MSDIQLHPCGAPGTGLMNNIRTSGRNRIFVNQEGSRFVNEGAARDVLAQAIFDQQDSTYWIVVNSVRYPDREWVDARITPLAAWIVIVSPSRPVATIPAARPSSMRISVACVSVPDRSRRGSGSLDRSS